jgi:hypothetical protein
MRPDAIEVKNGWIKPVAVDVPGYTEQVYGTDVIYGIFDE